MNLFKEKGWKYDPETGELITPNGNVVKSVNDSGYICCYIRDEFNKKFIIRGHRLGWFLHFSVVPNIIDHIDGNRKNNKLSNIRNVNSSQNLFNKKKTLGYHFIESRNKYVAYITFYGKRKHLGYFVNEEDAKQAYLNAKEKYHII